MPQIPPYTPENYPTVRYYADGRWVERVLSWRHTCRIRGRPTLPICVEAVSCLCKGAKPHLRWLTQHESLLVLSPP